MMKLKVWGIFFCMIGTARSALVNEFGREFRHYFVAISRKNLIEILSETPDIGDSIFALNYQYGPCYFAWYAALRSLSTEKDSVLQWIWRINEDFVKFLPQSLLRWFAKTKYACFWAKHLTPHEGLRQGDLHLANFQEIALLFAK